MPSPPSRDAARKILSDAEGRTVLVLGDLMLDRFIWGSVERISPEAPVPVVKVTHESFHLGGAGNVAANLAALGARPLPAGITGEGAQAEQLVSALVESGIGTEGVMRMPDRVTTVKTRIVAHSQQVVRYDREQDDPLEPAAADALAERTVHLLSGAEALIVSDYEKGCVTPRLLGRVLPAASRRGIPIVIDPKPQHWKSYTPATAITPNQTEAARMSGLRCRSEADLAEAARVIREALSCRGVVLTRGEKGMLLLEEGEPPFSIAASSREVYDVTGAGDTVVAALALALAAGASLRDAAALANAAAGVVVGKVGTATATVEEVLAAV